MIQKSDAQQTKEQRTAPASRPQHMRIVFALIIVAYFLDVIDFSIVQVALPSIQSEFAINLAEVQWIMGAYALTLAGFLMLSGRAGDIYGQKRIFYGGTALFTAASFFAGLSPSFVFLVAFRAIQGIGAALTTVTALAILIELFPEGKERNKAMGIFIAVLSAGFAVGSALGGALTVLFGWRSVMFVNVPIGMVATLLSVKFIPDVRNKFEGRKLDIPGAATVTSGLILMTYGLTNIANNDFSLFGLILPLISATILLGGFLFIESRSTHPLMPLEFLKRGSVLTSNVLGVLLASTVIGISFIMTIFVQQILHYSPLYAGVALLPGALIFFFMGGWGASRLVNKFGVRKILVASTTLTAVGAASLTMITADGNYYQILPGLILWALGASLGFPALNITAFVGIKPGEEGLASGLINTSFRIGFPLGLAVLLTVAGLTTPNPSAPTPADTVTGFHYALLSGSAIAILALLMSFKLRNPTFPSGPGPHGATATEPAMMA